jgi:hypothetical protein
MADSACAPADPRPATERKPSLLRLEAELPSDCSPDNRLMMAVLSISKVDRHARADGTDTRYKTGQTSPREGD